MGLLIGLTKRTNCLESQKTVYLGHGIAHRVKRSVFLEDRKRYTYIGHGVVLRVLGEV